MQLWIDGVDYFAEPGATVLEVARREGIVIPTLCHHPALPPYGACRLCVVEVLEGGRPGLAASCTLPVQEGLKVLSASPRVVRARQVLLQLLLAAVPGAARTPAVQQLMQQLGVADTPFARRQAVDSCVLCGRCVRACATQGVEAIGFAWRGRLRRVTAPWGKPPDRCVACQACARVCPTGVVNFKLREGRLVGWPWQVEREVVSCALCGQALASPELLQLVQQRTGAEGALPQLCAGCRRRHLAAIISGGN
ncbi:MAG: 2Fe-2S iron-sulfur cluster-binding protein [Desulfurispora sp.]|uniref:2Fe-2S iron-sulfur cluster-binding protein n=1 Tax=Desulfurispora sp. TaxID=3014275 RepID=UPI00404AE0B1